MIQLVLNSCFDRLTEMILPNSSQRFGIREPVGDLEQRGQVVEVDGDVVMIGPELASSMASARRISGSAPEPW